MKSARYFTRLPLLDRLTSSAASHVSLDDTMFVCAQHLLETTGSLIEALVALGARPEQIIILGKSYSTSEHVVSRLRKLGVNVINQRSSHTWSEFANTFESIVSQLRERVHAIQSKHHAKRLIVIDDGGHVILKLSRALVSAFETVVCIEQTTSGLKRFGKRIQTPVISVASAAVKRFIEAPMIARAVLEKTTARMGEITKDQRVGVIGLGNVGREVSRELIRRGYKVWAYDIDPSVITQSEVSIVRDLQELLTTCDVLFGCSGEDIIGVNFLKKMMGRKILVSCSSEDKEFKSLLRHYYQNYQLHRQPANYLSDIIFTHNDGQIRILRGGFPVNFDGSDESVPGCQVQITRALLLCAVLQGVSCKLASELYMLDADAQRLITARWFSLEPSLALQLYDADILAGINNLAWIEDHSGGLRAPCRRLSNLVMNAMSAS
jgi:S-adenosylhomocysteine hydrolase